MLPYFLYFKCLFFIDCLIKYFSELVHEYIKKNSKKDVKKKKNMDYEVLKVIIAEKNTFTWVICVFFFNACNIHSLMNHQRI